MVDRAASWRSGCVTWGVRASVDLALSSHRQGKRLRARESRAHGGLTTTPCGAGTPSDDGPRRQRRRPARPWPPARGPQDRGSQDRGQPARGAPERVVCAVAAQRRLCPLIAQ